MKWVSNSGMDNSHIDDRLTALEIKASFAEDTIERLDAIIIRQQDQIDQLVRELVRLRSQVPEEGSGLQSNPRDELPPHY